MSDPNGSASKRGVLTEMPPEFVDVVNRAVRGHLDRGLKVAKPGGGEKPALKMAIQAAVLLHFAKADPAQQEAIIKRGLAIYAELLAAPSPSKLKPPVVHPVSVPPDHPSARAPRKRRG